MKEPLPEPIVGDPLGDTFLQDMPASTLTVEVLGEVKTRAVLDQALAGWETAMADPGSLAWVRVRIAEAPPAKLVRSRRKAPLARHRSPARRFLTRSVWHARDVTTQGSD